MPITIYLTLGCGKSGDPQNNNKLVAFSVLDKGADSIQSIKGIRLRLF